MSNETIQDQTKENAALSEAVRQLFGKMRRHLQTALNIEGLHLGPPEAHMLHLVDVCPRITPQDIAIHTGHDKGFVTRKVKAMEAAGWVEREQDSTDNRRVRLKLTPNGRRCCAGIAKARREAHRAVFEALTSKEQDELARLLLKCL